MIEGHQSERSLNNLAQTRSVSRGTKEKGLSAEIVVSEIISTLKNTFGEGIIPAMEGCFESVYKISFNDNSIFDYPDRFAEALLYAFGVGREPMLRLINERLASSFASPEQRRIDRFGGIRLCPAHKPDKKKN